MQDIEVVGDDLIAYETIAVAALDAPPHLSKSSEATLLTVSEAIYRARLMGMKRDTWTTDAKEPGAGAEPRAQLGRYDLLESVFSRLQSPAAADDTKVRYSTRGRARANPPETPAAPFPPAPRVHNLPRLVP